MASFFLKPIFLSGFFSLFVLFLSHFVSGAPKTTTTLMPRVCVDDLVDLVTCLNSSTVNDPPGVSRINIVQRCNSLSATAKCKAKISPSCLTLPSFRDLDSLFGFASRISGACSSPSGQKNMLDLTECNDKNQQKFETCFDFTVIDQALSVGNNKDDFSSMCCVIRNGQRCYSPTVVAQCGQKGKNALDNTCEFLINAMNCDTRSQC